MLTVECIIVVDALQPSRTSMRLRSCLRAMAGSITMMSPDMLASQLRIELLLQWNHVTRTQQTHSLRHYALQKPRTLERCNPWPHVANRRISIIQLLSVTVYRHSRYYVIRY